MKRLNTFSQFLFDDYIHSPLRREEKFFKDNSENLDGKYPFERAEHFYKEVKRLGNFEDGKGFIDKFRVLITEIGNALGYVSYIIYICTICTSKTTIIKIHTNTE